MDFRICAIMTAIMIVPAMALSQEHIAAGYTGQVPARQIHRKNHVEVEALARLTNGSLSFHEDLP